MSNIEFEDGRASNFSARPNVNRSAMYTNAPRKVLAVRVMGWLGLSKIEYANALLIVMALIFFAISAYLIFG